MSLFQTSVIKKYLNNQSVELIDKKYKDFQAYFCNQETQENIINLKEEEFQEGFIRELFVNIFEYTLKPNSDFNIVLEKKNVDDKKKADGAILKDNHVIAVIELKSTQTTNLDTFRDQAFVYKNHNPKCIYVITSNFEKIRIYIQDTSNHLEFDLFNLSKDNFALLWLCFSKENLINDIPLKIKEASVLQEENVTKRLYNDYSKFREEIFNNIVKNNPEFDKLVLLKKTQKLLDRFLFIFFAQDRLLLPPNSVSRIIKKWNILKEEDCCQALYDIFKQYFGYINNGKKGQILSDDIFSYNGGLFLSDDILDNIKIDDDILYKNTMLLSLYDFKSEIDVSILGHIFEHSLGEIESIQAEIEGKDIDKQKTKRKKDGIFYTPKYITKYIVENTIGKLFAEKKLSLGIVDEEYSKSKKTRKKEIIKELDTKLNVYREWLLEITILDPACGSGAFLNQALEFLTDEHKKIDELRTQLMGGSSMISDIEAKILEKNIYGVDLNEESVEIAKLSLWLHTAQKGRKLTTLSNHIKCGNSLINNPNNAGLKAFNWENEFPEVFNRGGFDIIIGNPPYVVQKKDIIYSDYKWSSDLYLMFFELVLRRGLLHPNGKFGFITPRFFAVNKNCKDFREYLLKNDKHQVSELVETSPFIDTETECLITIMELNKAENDKIIVKEDRNMQMVEVNQISKNYCLSNENYEFQTFLNEETISILNKIEKDIVLLSEISISKRGMEIGKNDFQNNGLKTLVGHDTTMFRISFNENYVDPAHVQYQRLKDFFNLPNLIYLRRVAATLIASMSDEKYAFNKNLYGIFLNDDNFNPKYILGLLNSKLLNFYYKKKFSTKKIDLFPEIQSYLFNSLPIKKVNKETQNDVASLCDSILTLNKTYDETRLNFFKYLKSQIDISDNEKKLKFWQNLSPLNFEKELKKNISEGVVSKGDFMDWMLLFENKKSDLIKIEIKISELIEKLNLRIFNIYGVEDNAIKIIENVLVS